MPNQISSSNSGSHARPLLADALESLPVFPAVAIRLLEILDDSEVPMSKIVDLLQIDPALSMQVLRVANSPLCGMYRQVNTLLQAIVILGTERVKRLALTLALGRFVDRFLHDVNLEMCWRHSVACALVSEQLSQATGHPNDRAYTAGLLHDIGRLVLLIRYQDEYAELLFRLRGSDTDPLQSERELFGLDHCQVGEQLADRWHLPRETARAIGMHHSREPADRSLPSIIAGACRLTAALGFDVQRSSTTAATEEIISALPVQDPTAFLEELACVGEKMQFFVRSLPMVR